MMTNTTQDKEMLAKILKSFAPTAKFIAICFLALYLMLVLPKRISDPEFVLALACAVGFSSVRPRWEENKIVWFLFDGLSLVAMLVAFSPHDYRLALWEFVAMRGHGYVNLISGDLLTAALFLLAIFSGFLLFQLNTELYSGILIGLAIFFGGIVQISVVEENAS